MIETGTILQDRYLIDKQIGAGGMGAVYLATDQRFGSTVAIKETFFTDENLRRAFEREARLLNSLRHAALARVSDHFTDGQGQFLVMEYIPGDDLSELLAQRSSAFPVSEVMTWADQLLDALDYLHTQEMPVVHRDIKPQNLKLTNRGQIILLDFGLAKGNPTNSDHQTNTKSVFGFSRVYAPLEQIQGTGTDPRSDFYSLAATLYHLITGVPPEDALTRATAVLNGNPDPLKPPHQLRPEIPPAISAVIMKAMALNANYRPSSAAAMRALLLDAKNDISPYAEQETLIGIPAAGIFDQQTQVIGGENTATAPVHEAQPTEQERAFVSGGAQRIDIPHTEATRISTAQPFVEKKKSRLGLGMGAAAIAATLLVGVCAAALYVYKPGLFGQTGNPVNTVPSENAVPKDPAAAETSGQGAAIQAGAENPSGGAKESAVKTAESKEAKAGEKAAVKSSRETNPTAGTDPEDRAGDPDEAEIEAKQKELQNAVNTMVQRKLKQANIRNRQQARDDGDDDPDDPPQANVRIFRQGQPNLPPRRPYVFKKRRP
jgi:predicted Ser/Thr protein kinase